MANGVKHIRLTTTKERFEKLVAAKGDRTWEAALMEEMAGETIEQTTDDEEDDDGDE